MLGTSRGGLPSLKILLIPVWFTAFAGLWFSLHYLHKDWERQWVRKTWLKEKKALKAVTLRPACGVQGPAVLPDLVWSNLRDAFHWQQRCCFWVSEGLCDAPGTGTRSKPGPDSCSGVGTFPLLCKTKMFYRAFWANKPYHLLTFCVVPQLCAEQNPRLPGDTLALNLFFLSLEICRM